MVKLKSVVLVALLAASFCFAQLNRGTLTGSISDPSGAVVPGVKISVTHIETGTTASTEATSNGDYTLPALVIGTYRVEYEAQGFKKAVRDQVQLTAGATMRLDIALELGSVGESVQVSAAASPIETETTRVATNITTKMVTDLPLAVNGAIRSVFNLAIIAPETKTANGFRIGGGQGSAWEMAMDGMPTTSGTVYYQEQRAPVSSVSIDAISEFTVETTGMKAEFGRSNGAITFATKSGTNQVHGSMFEFLRNNAMDARNFFDLTGKAPILKQHDFGATLGAPVYIPKVYNGRNKSFFFFSYEGFRNRAGSSTQYLTIPTPENYNGDFSGWTRNGVRVPIYDPRSTRPNPSGDGYIRDVFANSLIPQARFSGVASRYITLRPSSMVPNYDDPATPDPIRNFATSTGAAINPWNKFSVRGDHVLNSKDRFSGLWLRGVWQDKFGADGPPGLPVPFNGATIWARKSASGRFTWDRTISARVINTFRVSYQKERGDLATLNSVNPNDKWNEKLKIPNVPGPDRALPGLSFTGYNGWSGNSWGLDAGGNFNLTNDVTFVRNNHTIKTGFFHAHDRWDGGGQHRPNGGFGFTQLATANALTTGTDQTQNTGNGFASFLLGYASSGGVETPRIVRQYYKYYGGYIQDDWKVTSRLTLNLGLRYEYTPSVMGGAFIDLKTWEDTSTGKMDGFSNFDPTAPNPGAGGRPGALVFSGNGPGRLNTNSMFDAYKAAFSPRVGLVFRLKQGTVVRMYGGRQLGAVKVTGASTHFDGFIVNSNISSSDNSLNDFPAIIDNGPPAWTKPPFIDPTVLNNQTAHFWQRSDSGRPSEYYNWNLDIQHELTPTTVLTTAYSGSKGTHLASALTRYNQIDPKLIDKYGVGLLNSNAASAAAQAAGIPLPYAGYGSLASQTVRRALSPFPQYGDILTNGAQPESVGERAGNSTYHALVLKLDKRYSSGVSLLTSYVFSKLITDSDTALITNTNTGGSLDHFNRGLEKSLSSNDQTHVMRFAYSYDFPLGRGKKMDLGRVGNAILGDWTTSGFLTYESGMPDSVSTTSNPIGTGNRVFITSYEGWRAPVTGEKFDPVKDIWYNINAFNQGKTPAQLASQFGNATRNNPKLRGPWNLNENVTLERAFKFTERYKLTLRGEGFNVFNRVRWGGPGSSVNNTTTFGKVTSQGNTPRRMQVALRLVF